MNHSILRLLLSTLVLSHIAAPQRALAADAEKPMNVVFFLVDDYGWADTSYNGSTFYETANIDKLAASGTVFSDGYAASPVCSPTRAAIMAGKYPHRMDTTDWFGAPQPEAIAGGKSRHWTSKKPLLPASYIEHLPLEEVTIAEALKAHGYATFFAGKWHLGPNKKYYPEAQGFDINMGGFFRGGPYEGGKYFAPFTSMPNLTGEPGDHLPARLAEETSNFIKNNKDKPFLAYLSFYSVHTPIMGRPDLVEYYQAKKRKMGLKNEFGEEPPVKVRTNQSHAIYAAMIHAMDEAVGKVLDTLEEEGLAGNTLVIFTADNGGLSTSEGSPTSNAPLRAGKGWIYEGGIREPTLIRLPKHGKAGSTVSQPVISTDFYPTILEAAGLPLLPKQHADGVSLVPVLKDPNADLGRDAIIWHYPHYGNQGGSPASAIRAGDWKLIEWYGPGRGLELYNLVDDIGEKNNLVKAEPELARKLHEMLKKNLKDLDAKMNTPNPNAK
ncbi:MAG: sulfatase [Phycisphaeraceae bacterium]